MSRSHPTIGILCVRWVCSDVMLMESMCNADFVITSPSTPCTVLPPRDRTTKTVNAGFRRGQLKATSGTRNACGESSVVGRMACIRNADIVGRALEELTKAFLASRRKLCSHDLCTSLRAFHHTLCVGIQQRSREDFCGSPTFTCSTTLRS